MRTFLTAFIPLLLPFSASAVNFSCVLKAEPRVHISGKFSQTLATIHIDDDQEHLALRDLTAERIIQLDRAIRQNETKFGFAKYYGDLNAWQDIAISVPKSMTSKSFEAYLTTYGDDGNMMVPGESKAMSCTVQSVN